MVSTVTSDIHKPDYWPVKMNGNIHKQRAKTLCSLWRVHKHYGVWGSFFQCSPNHILQDSDEPKKSNPLTDGYTVTETLIWKIQEICPCRVSERDQARLILWSFLMSHRWGPGLRFKPHPGRFPSLSMSQASTLTHSTLKQLEVLSEMLRLMNKPNTDSRGLDANTVDYIPSSLSVNLAFSEVKPNQM